MFLVTFAEHDTVGLEDILKKKTIIKCHKSRNILELWHLMYINHIGAWHCELVPATLTVSLTEGKIGQNKVANRVTKSLFMEVQPCLNASYLLLCFLYCFLLLQRK